LAVPSSTARNLAVPSSIAENSAEQKKLYNQMTVPIQLYLAN